MQIGTVAATTRKAEQISLIVDSSMLIPTSQVKWKNTEVIWLKKSFFSTI